MAVSLDRLGWMDSESCTCPTIHDASMEEEWALKRGERARALSSCDNPKGPCKRTVRIPGEQLSKRIPSQTAVQSAECMQTGATVQLERRLQDNARLAPGARGRKLRFTLLGRSGVAEAEAEGIGPTSEAISVARYCSSLSS
jgi:hypothetical protein